MTDNVSQMPNRATRRAIEASGRKQAASKHDAIALQERINTLQQRFDQLLPTVNGVVQKMQGYDQAIADFEPTKKAVRAMDAAMAAMNRVAEAKGLYTEAEIREMVDQLFNEQYGLVPREYDGKFSDGDILFVTFKYFDENNKCIGDRPEPLMYAWGTNRIPGFDEKCQGAPHKELLVYEHQMAEDHDNKAVAGKKIRIEVTIHEVRKRLDTMPGAEQVAGL